MRRLQHIVTGTTAAIALTVGFAAAASAADLGRPGPAPVYTKAPMAPAWSWTGFYVGGNVGYGWGHSDLAGSACFDPTGVTCNYNQAFSQGVSAGLPGSVSPNSVLGGFQAGYNWQWQSIVAGIEGDYTFLNAQATRNATYTATGFGTFGPITETVQDKWLSTVRGRLGFTPTNNLLLFGTGGAAFGNVKYTTFLSQSPPDPTGSLQAGTVSTTKAGYAVGAGLEYALDRHWDVRAEYLYVNLGHVNLTTANPIAPLETTSQSASFNMNIVRGGVDYKF